VTAPGISGKVAVVTGGCRGIGAATASELHQHGASVAVLDVRPEPASDGVLVIDTDIADEQSVQRAFVEVRRALGEVRFLVNNAGVNSYAAADELTLAEWDRFFAVDLRGAVSYTHLTLPTICSV